MSNLILSVDLVNNILQYLGSRPFVEVAHLISEIQKEAAGQIPEQTIGAEEEVKAE